MPDNSKMTRGGGAQGTREPWKEDHPYQAIVIEAKDGPSKAGDPMTTLTLNVDPDGRAARMRAWIVWTDKQEAAAFAKCLALGLRDKFKQFKAGEADALSITDFLGCECRVTVRPEQNGRTGSSGQPFWEINRLLTEEAAAALLAKASAAEVTDADCPF